MKTGKKIDKNLAEAKRRILIQAIEYKKKILMVQKSASINLHR
jgi:hypothetical protein